MELTHLDADGNAHMVDVSGKPIVLREARAAGTVLLQPNTILHIKENCIAKGDVLSTARIAAIQGAKKTYELIPLCHQIQLDSVEICFTVDIDRIEIEAVTVCNDRTGVEMEAITAVSVAAITIYDMCKAIDKSITISNIRLLNKTKGAPR